MFLRIFGGLAAAGGLYGFLTGGLGLLIFGVFIISAVGTWIGPNAFVVNLLAISAVAVMWSIPALGVLSLFRSIVIRPVSDDVNATRSRSSFNTGEFFAVFLLGTFGTFILGAVVSIILSLLNISACEHGNSGFQQAILSQPLFMILYVFTPFMGPEMVESRDQVYASFAVCA